MRVCARSCRFGAWRFCFAAMCLAALGVIGCGRPALRPVVGTICIGGEKTEGVHVIFTPAQGHSTEGRQLGIGVSDASGRFEITSGSGAPGLEPGRYRVSFSRPLLHGKPFDPQKRPEGAVESIKPPHHDPMHTPIVVLVPSAEAFAFDLPR